MRLLGIAGADTAAGYRRLLQARVDLSEMAVSRTRTVTWHAVHDFQAWVTAAEETDPGCDDEWQAGLSREAAHAEVLFLGSMAPSLQLEVRRQSQARLTGCDTMTGFTDSRAVGRSSL